MGECFANNEDRGQREILRLVHEEITPLLKGKNGLKR